MTKNLICITNMAEVLLSHLNTLLFGVLSMGICAALLFMLAVPYLQVYFVFFLTTGLGLMIVTLSAFASIINGVNTAETISDTNSDMTLSTCPNYFGFIWDKQSNSSGNSLKACTSSNLLYNASSDTSTLVTLLEFVHGMGSCGLPVPTTVDVSPYRKTNDLNICSFVTNTENKLVPWTKTRPFCPKADPYPTS